MKLAMTNVANKLKIFMLIVKRIPVFMMNYLTSFKFPPQLLLHHPSVLERPLPGRSHLDGDVLPECAIGFCSGVDNPLSEHGKGAGMLHAPESFRLSLDPLLFVADYPETFFALGWVMKAFFVSSLAGRDRLATYTTWFMRQFFHTHDIIPNHTSCQWIFSQGFRG